MNAGRTVAIALVAGALAALSGCVGLKYAVLRGTSVPNPPPEPVAIYLMGFPVESKANIIEGRAVVGKADVQPSMGAISGMAEVGSGLMTISRPARIDDLSGAVLRELMTDQVRVFTDIMYIEDTSLTRSVPNPFRLVAEGAPEAQLAVGGKVRILSQRVNKRFSQETTEVEVALEIRDLATGRVSQLEPLRFGIRMLFNSKELEEAMAMAVVTYLTQETLL